MSNFWKIVTGSLFILSLASCAKDVSLDYRDAWIGTYSCTRYSYQQPYSYPPSYDTASVELTFLKDANSSNGIIFFNDTLYISNSGIYSMSNNSSHVFIDLIFRNDSVFYYYRMYSPGGTSTTTIIGKR